MYVGTMEFLTMLLLMMFEKKTSGDPTCPATGDVCRNCEAPTYDDTCAATSDVCFNCGAPTFAAISYLCRNC